tara:strand:- start:4667 stop:6466 length:1800 start_codon:yes stop_codon:yes gene_type:complete
MSPVIGQVSATKYYVGRVLFEGNTSYSDSRLRSILKLKKPGLFRVTEFNRRTLKLDAISLRNFYISEGYLKTNVEESYVVRESGEINILFKIEEGERFHLRSFHITGDFLISKKKIKKILGLQINKPFDPVTINNGFFVLEKEYKKLGKLYFSYKDSLSPTFDVEYFIIFDEGLTVKIDKIKIDGLQTVNSTTVLRELKFNTGDIYNEEEIFLSQRRLFETGLFSIVSIYPFKSTRGEDWVDLRIELREFKKREWLSEGGLYPIQSTSEGGEPFPGAGITMEWRNRNIFSKGTRFSIKNTLEIPISSDENVITNPILRFETIASRQWLGGLRFPTTLKIFYEKLPELQVDAERLTRYGLDWSYHHKSSEYSLWRGGLKLARIHSSEVDNQTQEQKQSFNLMYRYRKVDNPITPKKGAFFSVQHSFIWYQTNTTSYFYRTEFDYRRYYSIRNSWVLALRMKIGWVSRIGGSGIEVPSYDKYYLGGSTSLRGWEQHLFKTEIINEDKTSMGGNYKALINTELRIPVWGRFGINLFLEGGILEDYLRDVKSSFKEWSEWIGWDGGMELSISTPIGPVRIYYAVRLSDRNKKVTPNIGLMYAF